MGGDGETPLGKATLFLGGQVRLRIKSLNNLVGNWATFIMVFILMGWLGRLGRFVKWLELLRETSFPKWVMEDRINDRFYLVRVPTCVPGIKCAASPSCLGLIALAEASCQSLYSWKEEHYCGYIIAVLPFLKGP